MLLKFAKNIFVYMSTHSYSNLSRLFLRLFVGVMILQIGVNQMARFDVYSAYYTSIGMDGDFVVEMLIVTELICSVLVTLGLFMRLALLPLLAIMIFATQTIVSCGGGNAGAMCGMTSELMPMMFAGVFVFFGISGPGKISLDYILARYIVSYDASSIEEEKTLDEA